MLNEYQRDRLLLLAATLLAGLVTWGTAAVFGIPPHAGESASLLTDGGVSALLLLGVAILLGCAVAAVPAAYVRYDAGLGCCAAGLIAVAARLGTTGGLYRGAEAGVYLTLALETVVLFGFLGVGWWLVSLIADRLGRPDASLDMLRDGKRRKADEPLDQKLLAVAVNTATSIVLLMFILKSDDRGQAIACVALAGFTGALVAHQFVPTRPSPWFFAPPGLAGVAAYVIGWTQANELQMALGLPAGVLAALAQAAPLDWASAGVAGSLVGYWTSVRWKLGEEPEGRVAAA